MRKARKLGACAIDSLIWLLFPIPFANAFVLLCLCSAVGLAFIAEAMCRAGERSAAAACKWCQETDHRINEIVRW